MVLSHKKILKKKQKKQKKRRAKKTTITPKAFHSLPVTAAWETDFIQGVVSICFARRINVSEYHIAIYLLDTWALGVKGSYMNRVTAEGYEDNIENSPRYHRAEPGRLKSLIQDTVIFGGNNGFEPFGEYNKMLPFLSNITTKDSEPHGVNFGDDGRVVYIANSEQESPKEIKMRLATLNKILGHDNYSFVVPADYENSEEPNVYSKTYLTQNGKTLDIRDYPKEKIGRSSLVTTTGEPHMVTRLYYKVIDYTQAIEALQKLKCIDFVSQTLFHIAYDKEAKKFGLDVSYKKVPKKMFPIILGYGTLRESHTVLTIDIRSYKRTVSMLKFIDKHIERNILYLEEMASYNEIMHDPNFSFDDIFDDVENNPQEHVKDYMDKLMADSTLTKEEKKDKGRAYCEEKINKAIPLVSKHPISFYEGGVEVVEMSLRMQEIIAHEHNNGNTGETRIAS